ncbi:hypothetical protein MMC14_005590 [Varicellaria rhodocarpa]|nr:hypothetical protein [Varicellaria rhodocarpa]
MTKKPKQKPTTEPVRRSPRNHAPQNPPSCISQDSSVKFSSSSTVTKASSKQRADFSRILNRNGMEVDNTRLHIPDFVLKFAIEMAEMPTNLDHWTTTPLIKTLNTLLDSEEAMIPRTMSRLGLLPEIENFQFHIGQGIILPLTMACSPLLNQDLIPNRSSDTHEIHAKSPDEIFGHSEKAYVAADMRPRIQHLENLTKLCVANVYCPFFVLEYQSQSRGGTLWRAVNQNLVAASSIINAMIQLQEHLGGINDHESVAHSLIFSLVVDGLSASLSIHWYEFAGSMKNTVVENPDNTKIHVFKVPSESPAEMPQPRFLSSGIAHFRFNKNDEVLKLQKTLDNIFT